jgi:hypothetical protein
MAHIELNHDFSTTKRLVGTLLIHDTPINVDVIIPSDLEEDYWVKLGVCFAYLDVDEYNNPSVTVETGILHFENWGDGTLKITLNNCSLPNLSIDDEAEFIYETFETNMTHTVTQY